MIRHILGPLQKRVTLKLLLDEGGKFHIGELEKLDRLQKLRRHNQGLALAHDELSGERHYTDYDPYCSSGGPAARFLLATIYSTGGALVPSLYAKTN